MAHGGSDMERPVGTVESAKDRIETLIRELQDIIGPNRVDADGDMTDELCDGALLSQWVLVMAWIDPVDGEPYVTRVNTTAPCYQIDGLLRTQVDA